MEICQLCFQYGIDEEVFNNSDVENAFEELQKLIPFKNRVIHKTAIVCESCVNSIQTSMKLISGIKDTEHKIIEILKQCSTDKIDINTLCENNNDLPQGMKKDVTLCRLCLNLIPQSKLFLCENDTNILHYKLLQKMLEFCKATVNLQLTENPAMCLNCWKHLQIAYNFKKNYLEINRQIRIYTQKYHLRYRQIDKDVLIKIKQYFLDEKSRSSDENEDEAVDKNHFDMERINFEHNYIKSDVLKPELSPKNHQKKQSTFSKEKDHALLKSYFEVTNNEQKFNPGYWKKVQSMWLKLSSSTSISICKLQNRLSILLRDKSVREEVNKIRQDITRKNDEISINSEYNTISNDPTQQEKNRNQRGYYNYFDSLEIGDNSREYNIYDNNVRIKSEPQSDTDDTFTEEAYVKTEPLSESDTEIDVVDSLPQLERMDIQPMTFRIDEIYSLDEKKFAFNSSINDLYLDPNLEVEEVKTCRKFSFKNQMDQGLFKCLSCNFETKSRISAERHSRWHSDGSRNKKIYQCQICPYKISNRRLLKIHEKFHKAEDEIPVLLPMCI